MCFNKVINMYFSDFVKVKTVSLMLTLQQNVSAVLDTQKYLEVNDISSVEGECFNLLNFVVCM